MKNRLNLTRREALRTTAGGLGSLATSWLLQQEGAFASSAGLQPAATLAAKAPHFPAKAIEMYMAVTGND